MSPLSAWLCDDFLNFVVSCGILFGLESMKTVRYIQVFMACSALIIAFILRVNMSVAIVAMTDPKQRTESQFEAYKWTEAEKSAILSSFFGGYGLLQIVAGNTAEKYGSKLVLTLGMTFSSLATLVVPYCAERSGYEVMCALRVVQGAMQGLFFPAIMVLLSNWIPPSERGRALTVAYSGSTIGMLFAFPLSGYLASSVFGWPSIFYVTGGLGFLWVLLWMCVGASTPDQHSFISKTEKNHIETSLTNINQSKEKKLKTPWKYIATSLPVWSILISHLGQNWGNWTLLTEMPNFINSVLGMNIRENGILCALPYVCGWTTAILFSWISHKIDERGFVSKTVQRKIWNSIALWGGALVLFILGISNMKNTTTVIIMLIMTVGFNSGIFHGFLTNHIDLSPNFCGTLMGITNSLASVTAGLGPLAVGWLVDDPSSQTEWKHVFILASAIMFGTNLFYLFFGDSEVQSWNDLQETENTNNICKL